jgi:hypothetical protein
MTHIGWARDSRSKDFTFCDDFSLAWNSRRNIFAREIRLLGSDSFGYYTHSTQSHATFTSSELNLLNVCTDRLLARAFLRGKWSAVDVIPDSSTRSGADSTERRNWLYLPDGGRARVCLHHFSTVATWTRSKLTVDSRRKWFWRYISTVRVDNNFHTTSRSMFDS